MNFSQIPTLTIIVLSCFVVYVSCENRDNCTFSLKAGVGAIQIPPPIKAYEDVCKTIIFEMETKSLESIINITSSSYTIDTNTSSTPTYPNSSAVIPAAAEAASTRNVLIVFEEISFHQDGTNSSLIMETWDIRDRNLKVNRMYFSRTSHLRLLVNVTGDWKEDGVELSYEELEFNVFNMSSQREKGEVSAKVFGELVRDRYYRPHSAYFYYIHSSQNMNVSSISMTLNYLDIDEGVGEYLLIGSGDTPFHGSPALFLSNKVSEKKNYKINDKKAYIIFVAASTRQTHKGFSIRWRHDGTKIDVKDDKIPPGKDDVLQSIQVCIYNHKAALNELQKPKTDQFNKFRKELAEGASKIAEDNSLPSINTDQISFYRLSAIDSSDKFHKDGLLYVMLKIEGSEKGKAAFNRALLEKSFKLYNTSQEIDGYKIGACPKRRPMNSGFYAMVPLFCCFLLLIWAAKQKPVSDFIMKMQPPVRLEKERMSGAEDNFYSAFPPALIPTLRLFDEQGRRLTLNYNDTIANFVDDDTKFDFEEAHRPPNTVMDFLNANLPDGSRIIRAEINEGFVDDESCSTAVKSTHDMLVRNETENVYDSLKSAKSTDEACDTKL